MTPGGRSPSLGCQPLSGRARKQYLLRVGAETGAPLSTYCRRTLPLTGTSIVFDMSLTYILVALVAVLLNNALVERLNLHTRITAGTLPTGAPSSRTSGLSLPFTSSVTLRPICPMGTPPQNVTGFNV